MKATEFVTETWPLALARAFNMLRKSQKFKHLPDDKIKQMSHAVIKKQNNPAPKKPLSSKELLDKSKKEMSDQEFKNYWGFNKFDESVRQELAEVLKRVNGRWALVSKSDPNKVLQYYRGPKDQKPSDEWVNKVERRVHAFGG